MRQDDDKNTSIEKALKILLAYIPYNQEMSTTELSDKLGLHKATVSRTLQVLTRYGMLIQNPQTRKYILGGALIQLGALASQSFCTTFVQVAKPYIDELRETLKETVAMEVMAGDDPFMAYVAQGPQSVRVAATVGEMLPWHAAAGSKAILAFSPAEVQNRITRWPMKPLTANTIVDHHQFMQHLVVIRREGVAFDNEEIDRGVTGVAAPIIDRQGQPIAAVVVVGPSQRIGIDKKAEIVGLLKDAAAKVSAQF